MQAPDEAATLHLMLKKSLGCIYYLCVLNVYMFLF